MIRQLRCRLVPYSIASAVACSLVTLSSPDAVASGVTRSLVADRAARDATSVHRRLRTARAVGDRVQVRCLDRVLSQLNALGARARSANRQSHARAAVTASLERQRAELVAEARDCARRPRIRLDWPSRTTVSVRTPVTARWVILPHPSERAPYEWRMQTFPK